MRNILPMLLAALALTACDDGGGGGSTIPDPDQGTDGGLNILDMKLPDADVPRTDAEPDGDMGPTPDGGEPSLCDPAVGFGPVRAPMAVADTAQYTPRVTWSGNRWGVTWRSPGNNAAGLDEIWFQRVSGDGVAEGDPALLGPSRSGLHAVAFTGTRFAVVYASARIDGGGFAGLALQLFDTDGAPEGSPIELADTYDAGHLALAWSNGGSGMVTYTRGDPIAGSAGLYVRPLSPDGTPEGPAVQVSTESVQAPTVVFGDATWGLAWLARASARPNDLLFTVLDERGRPALAAPRRVVDAGAQGQVHLAYGGSTYGLGWSQIDELGVLALKLSLYDLAGDSLGVTTVPGPTGFGAVTGVSWLNPSFFGVAWQDSGPGERSTVGLTRVNATGQVLAPVALAVEPGAPATGLSVAGTISKVGAFYTRDHNPLPVGFSNEARVEVTLIAPCN